MSRWTMLQKNGITNMVCKNEDCHTAETYCPCTITDQCECPTLKEVIEKLAHYEDLEEQGRLIEVKEGRWVDNHCSICGMTPLGEELWEHLDLDPPKFENYMNYCPECGAKMRELKGE